MIEQDKKKIVAQSWLAHELVEQSYLDDPAIRGEEGWLEKQRILLADMALHLLQTALSPDEINRDKLRNNIYSILTIADQFLPEAELNQAKEKIFQ